MKQHHEILVTGLQEQIDRLTAKVVELIAQTAAPRIEAFQDYVNVPDDKGGNDAK
jgi:hypothetical protein